jgi:DNA-binding GntR family transcriptional regulator
MASTRKPQGDSPPASAVWPRSPIGRVAAPLRDQVLEVVRQGILDFQLRPGQRLIERELIEQLGVSRATIREVVARLVAEGLVTVIPQRGAIVSVLSIEEATDIYEMRVALEALAVRRFVERATPEQVADIRAACEQLESVPIDGDDRERLAAKDAFYAVLFQGAASPPLTQTLTILQSRVRLLRWTSLSAPGRPEETVREIRAIVTAIEAKDGDAAAEASAVHVRNAAATAIARMAEAEQALDGTALA